MTTKLMVCQLRKGDVILGSSGARFTVEKTEMKPGSIVRLTFASGLVRDALWFASVVVELGGAEA